MKSYAPSPVTIPSEEVEPLSIEGLYGRLLHLKSNEKKKFVFLSGQHAAHERSYAIAKFLNDYGEVYSPDLPGFGGMDSFYKIGKKPTYDNYADYLYTFLKSKKLKNVNIFATSYSAQCVTRMFQKYPDSREWVDKVIFFVGFAAGSNFHVSPWYKAWLYSIIYPVSTRVGSTLMNWLVLNRVSIWLMVKVFSIAKAKMQSDDQQLKDDMVKMEAFLWANNDNRTHATTAISMFRDDLRRYSDEIIDINIVNIVTDDDQYFSVDSVKQTFEEIFGSYEAHGLNLSLHAPSLIADKAEVQAMMSKETIKLLAD